jgi:hypothetical protein
MNFIVQNKDKNVVKDKENIEYEELIGEAQIYIVILTNNKTLETYFREHLIRRGKVITVEDISKLSNADMIYFIASEDISQELRLRLSKLIQDSTIKVYISPNKLKELGSICDTHIKNDINHEKIHWFLKSIIEAIAIPSLVGLDYVDVKGVLSESPIMFLKRYEGKLTNIDKTIEQVKREFKQIDNVFFTLHSSKQLKLDDINYLGEKLEEVDGNVVYSATINDKKNDDFFELALFVGFNKKEI